MEDNKVSVQVISDVRSMLSIEGQWNALVHDFSNNPFLLSEFAKQFIEHIPKGWTPAILVIFKSQKIIGIAPLKTRKSLIGGHADFLNQSWCSDFIFDMQHREVCVKFTLDFLFNTLKCRYASFTLSSDSPNLKLLSQHCTVSSFHLKVVPENGRRILPLKSSLAEYEASRKRKFEKSLRRAERNLSKIGEWTVMLANGNDLRDIDGRINDVERRSWKEKWRNQVGEKDDWTLASVIEAARKLASAELDFKWFVWFLELKGETIAFQIAVKYKAVAFLVKTSFDERYTRYYPGIIVQDSVIQQLFTEPQNEYIDFLSDLPYLEAWTDKVVPRITLQLTKGTIPNIIHTLSKNKFANKIISPIMGERTTRQVHKLKQIIFP